MATELELIADLQAVAAKQEKTKGEIRAIQASMDTLQATIVTLEEALAAAGNPSQALVDAVAAVKQGAQETDDLIPDPDAPV
jgi:prefoldin subunit 5